jgi:hypothetical protein
MDDPLTAGRDLVIHQFPDAIWAFSQAACSVPIGPLAPGHAPVCRMLVRRRTRSRGAV